MSSPAVPYMFVGALDMYIHAPWPSVPVALRTKDFRVSPVEIVIGSALRVLPSTDLAPTGVMMSSFSDHTYIVADPLPSKSAAASTTIEGLPFFLDLDDPCAIVRHTYGSAAMST